MNTVNLLPSPRNTLGLIDQNLARPHVGPAA